MLLENYEIITEHQSILEDSFRVKQRSKLSSIKVIVKKMIGVICVDFKKAFETIEKNC